MKRSGPLLMHILQDRNQYSLLEAIRRVFTRPAYMLLATLSGGGLLFVLSFLPHRSLLWSALTSPALTVEEKWLFFQTIISLLGVNMSLMSSILAISVGGLFGVQSAMLVYYIRRRRINVGQKRIHATSLAGLVAALLGIGCAACGSVIVLAVLSLFGASGLLALLPLGGFEFGLIGVALLWLSIVFLARRIDDPLVCSVD